MYPKGYEARLARLQRECEVSVGPTILLLASCSVLVLTLALNVLTY